MLTELTFDVEAERELLATLAPGDGRRHVGVAERVIIATEHDGVTACLGLERDGGVQVRVLADAQRRERGPHARALGREVVDRLVVEHVGRIEHEAAAPADELLAGGEIDRAAAQGQIQALHRHDVLELVGAPREEAVPRLRLGGGDDGAGVGQVQLHGGAQPRDHRLTQASRKRFTFFNSISSHMPFHPVPPYQPDWQKLLSSTPFDEAQMVWVAAQKVDWLNMFPGYVGMIDYNYRWLAGYLAQPRAREVLFILLGDHQPAANVTGEGASWDVPVHIISARPELLQRFVALGFKAGLEPSLPRIGAMFDLTRILMDAFDAGTGKPAAVAER